MKWYVDYKLMIIKSSFAWRQDQVILTQRENKQEQDLQINYEENMMALYSKYKDSSVCWELSVLRCDKPLFELRVDNPVRESLSTDTDSFKYTITLELIEYKGSIDNTYRSEHTHEYVIWS